jgi:hypothetical protein
VTAALLRLFPAVADNRFQGHRAALWLLGLFIALKFVMSVNSIFNTAAVAQGADGIPLDTFAPEAARAVLLLFALLALGQLMLAVTALTALIRYRALVPLIYALLLVEQIARRLILESYAVARTGSSSAGSYVNYGLLALLSIGFALSLLRPRKRNEA